MNDKLKFKESLNEIYKLRLTQFNDKEESQLDKTFTINKINSESCIEVIK
jgi:hypothetical protein